MAGYAPLRPLTWVQAERLAFTDAAPLQVDAHTGAQGRMGRGNLGRRDDAGGVRCYRHTR